MGSIASVLQWHCNSCALINPTERVSCIRCGKLREENPEKNLESDVASYSRTSSPIIYSKEDSVVNLESVSNESSPPPSAWLPLLLEEKQQKPQHLPANVEDDYAKPVYTDQSSVTHLKKPSSCSSFASPLHSCLKCGHSSQQTASKPCVVCVPPVTVLTDGMLYENGQLVEGEQRSMGPTNRIGVDLTLEQQQQQPPQQLPEPQYSNVFVSNSAAPATNAHRWNSVKATAAPCNSKPDVVDSAACDSVLADIKAWPCRTCNYSNARTSIKCIVCENTNNEDDDDDSVFVTNDTNNNNSSSCSSRSGKGNVNEDSNNNKCLRKGGSGVTSDDCDDGTAFTNAGTSRAEAASTTPPTGLQRLSVNDGDVASIRCLRPQKSCSSLPSPSSQPPSNGQRHRSCVSNGSANAPRYSYIGINAPTGGGGGGGSVFGSAMSAVAADSREPMSESRWTCDRCSFAENVAGDVRCAVCDALASECSSTIVVAKDSVRYTPPKRKSSGGTAAVAHSHLSGDPLSQSLSADFQFLPASNVAAAAASTPLNCRRSDSYDGWVCKKCTLVNATDEAVCVACGGSKISSLTSTPEATLKRGEFWLCRRCTLKNPLRDAQCSLCKTPNRLASSCDGPPRRQRAETVAVRNLAVRCKATAVGKTAARLSFLEGGGEGATSVATTAEHSKCWICDECTFENSVKSPCCEMCQSARTVPTNEFAFSTDTFSKHLSDSDNTSIVLQTKQQSELMEQLRQKEEEEALVKWQHIVQYCKENNSPFVDDSFPPAPKSLYLNGVDPANNRVTQWLRPHQLNLYPFEDDPGLSWTVFRNPLPDDICQGILGNCWLISALTVLAERENFIKKVMVTREYCPEGVYQVRLCMDGKWVTILVDDLLPCNVSGYLLYSRARRKQLWVPLIEKAVAKVYGSYEALVSGRSNEGLAALTGTGVKGRLGNQPSACTLESALTLFLDTHFAGQPCERVPLQQSSLNLGEVLDKDLIWAQLLSSRQTKFLMAASCGGGNMRADEEEYRQKGLRARHAYAVLDVRNIHGHRLLQLRNPWGRFSWLGDWSEYSDKWTAELRQLLAPQGLSAGVFWISLDDVLKHFDSIDICRIRESGWNEVRVKGILPPLSSTEYSSCFLLTVLEPTEAEFTVFQESQRNSPFSSRYYQDLCVVVLRARAQASTEVRTLVEHSRREVRTFTGLQKILESDLYLLVCLAFNHWHTGIENPLTYPQYVLAIHSSKRLLVEQISPPPFVLADTLISLTLAKGHKHEGREGMTAYYLTKGWAGLVVMVENRHDNQYVQVRCDCRESFNVTSTRGDLRVIDSVPPLHRQVIIVLTQLEGTGGFSIAHRLTHRLFSEPYLTGWAPERTSHFPEIDKRVEGLHAPRFIT